MSQPFVILVVDDTPSNLFTLRELLKRLPDCEVLEASSGAQALTRVLERQIDLILLDVQMPGMDGFETARHLQMTERSRTIPVVFVTAVFRSEEFSQRGYEIGAVDYLAKPIDDNLLLNRVRLYRSIRSHELQLSATVEQLREREQALVLTKRAVEQQVEARTAELAEAHQRLSNILWGTGVGTWEWNVQTGETRFNERWAELLGYTLDELAPVSIDTWKRLAHPDDLVASGAALERHFSGATEAYEFESRMLHKQGHWIWVYDRGRVASRSEGGRPLWMAGTHFDITERKRGEEALAELRAGLEQRVEEAVADLRTKDQLLISQGRHAAMGEMIGNIAHQWRQPLNALALVLANLRDSSRFGELDAATVDQAVAVGNRLIGKMSSTISVFANFFRPEEEPRAFSGLAQLRETLTLVEASFKNAGIALDLEAPAEVAFFGYANEYSQVLLNLLGNAREAIEGSQVTPGRVSLRLEEREGLGCLTVRDNGGGIAQDLLGKVFDPYFSTKEGGTGLGLYICQQIVRKSSGGRLEVRNVEGGAEFAVFMPLHRG